MKKILLTLFALVTFLTAPTLIQAALVTTPWRYNTTTQSIYPYPLSVQKVGIGTAAPEYALDVIDTGQFGEGRYVLVGKQNTDYVGLFLRNTGFPITSIPIGAYNYTDSSYYFAGSSTAPRIVVNGANGNVGIGTAAPTTGVHVLNRSMAVENGTLIVANAGQSYFSYLGVNILGINDAGLYTSGDSAIAVNVGNNYYYGAGLLRVRSDTGRLGIGSTTPGTILSIGDTGANTINISATATSTFGSGLNIRTGCFAINGTCLSTGGSSGSSYPFNLSGNATSTLTQFNGGLTAYASTTIGNGTSIGGLTISGNSTTTGTAYFAGSVGIGTTSPWGKLSVANSSLSALPAFVVSTSTASATSTAFIVGANGNVGIGSTTPNYALSISNTMFYNATSQFLRVGDSGGSTYLGKYPGGFGLGGLWHGGSTPTGANYSFITDGLDSYFNAPRIIYFRINNNTSGLGMAIASNSNVGIATTSPLGRLSVEMDTTNPSFIISNQGSSTPAFVVGGVNQNGNVGIGTTSPGQKLSVAGDILGNNIIGSNFTATSSTATNYFAGNVGLATTSPGARLGIQSNSPDGYFEVFRGNKTTLALPGEDLFAFTIKSIVTGKNAFRINNESPYSVLLGENGFGKVGVSTSSPWAVFSLDSALIDPLDKTLPAFLIASSTTSNLIVTYSGNVGVGTTSPWRKLSVTGTAAISGLTAFASGDSAVCQRAGGEITANSGVTSCIVSSKFVKDPQGDISYQKAFDRITRLQPVMFKYKDGGKEDLGLYAEDVAKVDARYAQYTTQEKEVNGHHFNVGDPSAINWAAINADMIVVLQHQTLSGRAMRTAENNWQWIALVILGLIVAKQQLDIKKLNRE